MYPFVVKVHYWDDFYNPAQLAHTYILVYADSFADAANRMEKYFGNDIEDMKIMSAGDQDTLFEVSGKIANALIIGLGNYKDGIAHMREAFEKEEAK